MTDVQQIGLLYECGRVFTPGSPISRQKLFAGRLDQLRRIFDTVHSPGKHAIVYGDMGVGKTSLASILKELFASSTDNNIFVSRINCEPKDNFPSVWDRALAEVPILVEGEDGNSQHTLNQWLDTKEYVGPGQIRRVLQVGNQHVPELVIVFDEFDKLAPEWRAKFADTIKDLSDSLTSATVILVGVADDVTSLIANHASVDRSLTQIKMPPMSRAEVREILEKGLGQLGMTMAAEPFEMIVTLSQGYPHYAHLLAKEAALSAINNRRFDVHTGDVTTAIRSALDDVGYSIPDLYHKATLAQRRGTLFEQVLIACALATVDEMGYFASTDVRPTLSAITKKQYEIYGFSQHLERFSSDDSRGPVLEKRGSGRCYRYRFRNPLLRPYAIIKGMADGLVTIDMVQRMNSPVVRKKAASRAPRTVPVPNNVTTPQPTPPTPGLFDNL